MKKILLVLALFTLVSCEDERHPLKEEAVNNADYKVQFLFEHDGCKMYRFRDSEHWVYYSDCRGKLESTYTEGAGDQEKTVHRQTLNN